ncbi:beta-ketoacyl-[acyl-carrier-protein] synthase family protein [Lapidilactobacillus mulanensis]|uniref:Beta-ketoacyl-[acyl-carrier-protein] synthase family protein n=1 Tax=Lapidilactobacillus mulanensis TaxID=2485999 RepID=A0ABW4DLX4_9LACO|nr:beta-ketoacyl-[acyl-carrier-protein] synthase family protein [Lapidilactobacillus mulanensis]
MKEVVVTGIGIITPMGIGKEQFWQNDFAGKSYVKYNKEMKELGLKSHVSCQIENFLVSDFLSGEDLACVKSQARFTQFALIAANEAVEDSKIIESGINGENVGTVLSSAIGGTPEIQKVYESISGDGLKDIEYKPVGDQFYNHGMFNYPATVIAHKFGFTNVCMSLSTGCTAGLDAVGEATSLIKNGDAKIILAGAAEAPLSSLTYSTLDAIGALSQWSGAPDAASRPFDKKRKGFVISEGACILVLEEKEHALLRKAHIYAEIESYASHNNAHHMTDLKNSDALEKTLEDVLETARLDQNDINYINAHGSSTMQNDLCESIAIKNVFNKSYKTIPVSSTKSMMGHPLASASLIALTSVLGAIKYSKIPGNINLDYPDLDCDINLPKQPLNRTINHALIMASGFGGIHSACIVKKVKGDKK